MRKKKREFERREGGLRTPLYLLFPMDHRPSSKTTIKTTTQTTSTTHPPSPITPLPIHHPPTSKSGGGSITPLMVHGGDHGPLVGVWGVLFGGVLSHVTVKAPHGVEAVAQDSYTNVTSLGVHGGCLCPLLQHWVEATHAGSIVLSCVVVVLCCAGFSSFCILFFVVFLSFRAVLCFVLLDFLLCFFVFFCVFMSCHVMLWHFMSCHVMAFYVMSCHFMSVK